MIRTLVAWCPDWPVVAAGFGAETPVAVVAAGVVVACSAAARDHDVVTGLRRRVAEARCGDLVVLVRDEAREARAFEPVAAALCRIAPGVEVTRPGLASLATRGPARYHGGETALCQVVREAATGAVGRSCAVAAPDVRVGVADGPFAAVLAARRSAVVPAGKSADFLTGFGVGVLGRPELADLLVRLGISTLGEFAALDERSVAARFGPDGAVAHRLARGLDDRPLRASPPPAELVAMVELDPPAERVDVAVFAGRTLGEELAAQLAARGLACTLLTIEAETEHGEALARQWRAEVDFGPQTMGERLRWQLEGWLAGTVAEEAPTGGIIRISFRAAEVIPAVGQQLGFWGGVSGADRRARRGLDRLAGMLGHEAVRTAALGGGRGPGDRVSLVAWGDSPPEAPSGGPWPGRVPAPAAALVHRVPRAAEVCDRDGLPVSVSARGRLSGIPATITLAGDTRQGVTRWAGPWLADERWWDPQAGRRRARFQLLAEDHRAYLCFVEANRWWVEATYD